MILKYGNMWENYNLPNHVLMITTNSFVKNNGELVMGRGIAKEAKELIPDLPKRCGQMITDMNVHLKFYGVLMILENLGIFQVKYNWSDKASLKLIENSSGMLERIALEKRSTIFDLNFPGIGNGYLNYEQVLPLVKKLPENVRLWQFK